MDRVCTPSKRSFAVNLHRPCIWKIVHGEYRCRFVDLGWNQFRVSLYCEIISKGLYSGHGLCTEDKVRRQLTSHLRACYRLVVRAGGISWLSRDTASLPSRVWGESASAVVLFQHTSSCFIQVKLRLSYQHLPNSQVPKTLNRAPGVFLRHFLPSPSS